MFAAARWSVGVVLLSLAALAHAGDRGAREWLERMSESMSTRNYEARFFRIRDSRSDGWRIIHRVDRGRATERLVSLDGSGREYIRNEAEVICYLPDQRKVLVEKRAQESTLLSTVPVYSERLEANYSIELGGATKTLGRRTQLILVKPRDQFRYGYRLWLDEETAMPLKSQLVDRNGNIIEQILFAELHFRERISADALKPSVATDGFQWIYQDTQPRDPQRHLGLGHPAARRVQAHDMARPSHSPVRAHRCSISCIPTAWPRCPCSSSRAIRNPSPFGVSPKSVLHSPIRAISTATK